MLKNRYTLVLIYWKPAIILIFGVLVIMIGLLLSDLPKMLESLGWPTTGGTILSHKLSRVKFKEFNGDFYTITVVYIRYGYAVNGISRESSALNSLSINSIVIPSYPPSYANRYPVGKNVLVYYNPKNPAEAVLEPGLVDISKAFGGYSSLFLVVGVFFVIIGIWDIRKVRDKIYVKELMEKYRLHK